MDQERTYKWVQDRIRDLHAGRLSAADRARLHDIAKTDPFVQDALEGYNLASHQDHDIRLQFLSRRIQNKSAAKRRRLFPSKSYWLAQAVAASLLLIFVTWAVIFYMSRQDTAVLVSDNANQNTGPSLTEEKILDPIMDQKNDIVYETPSPEIESAPPGLRTDAQSRANEYLKEKPSSTTLSSQPDAVANAETPLRRQEPYSAPPAAGTQANKTEVEESRSNSADIDESVQENSAASDAGLYANQMPQEMMARKVSGQILDTYGQPVTGAQISISNTNLITLSNTYGRFEMYLPETTAAVEFYSTGYLDTVLTLSQGQEDVVVMLKPAMQQDYQLYSTKGKETMSAQAGAAGQQKPGSYLTYLLSASRFPVETNYAGAGKQVTLHFQVGSNGRPDNIKVAKSNTSATYRKEAIRLIEEGPDWICEEKYPCNKEYTLYFK